MEWLPIEGATLTKILAGGITTGGVGWLLRNFPRTAQRWIENRVNVERRAIYWEMTAKQQQVELDHILQRVAESRERQEKLDSIIGSVESLDSIRNQTPSLSTLSEQSMKNSTD